MADLLSLSVSPLLTWKASGLLLSFGDDQEHLYDQLLLTTQLYQCHFTHQTVCHPSRVGVLGHPDNLDSLVYDSRVCFGH